MGAETVRITVVGGLAILAVIIAAILLLHFLRGGDKPASEERPPQA
jgi:hypothetical protein